MSLTLESLLGKKKPAEIKIVGGNVVVVDPDQVPIKKSGKESVLWAASDDSNIAAWFIYFKGGNSPFKNKHFGKLKGEIEDSGEVRPDVSPTSGNPIIYPYTVIVVLDNGTILSADPDVVVDM